MAKRKSNNQGEAIAALKFVLACSRRIAVHWKRDDVARVVGVPRRKLYDLRLALKQAGVDLDKARNNSAGAYKASKAVRAKRAKRTKS